MRVSMPLHRVSARARRTLIRARTGEGRERAKARGARFRRPKKLSPHQRREAIDRIEAVEAVAEVAGPFGIDRAPGPPRSLRAAGKAVLALSKCGRCNREISALLIRI
jgi:DNA invertase Pin-like site-specific DNA recombinase